jgi:hypothetical protein
VSGSRRAGALAILLALLVAWLHYVALLGRECRLHVAEALREAALVEVLEQFLPG